MFDNYIHLIKKSTLLATLSPEEIDASLRNGQFKIATFKKNNIVHFDGELCNRLDIILSGKVVVDRIDESGNLMTIADFYSNDILGGNLLFSKHPYYPMTITANLPSILLEIDKALLLDLCSNNHLFLRTYLEFISDHASILSDKIKQYVHKSIRESVTSYLTYEQRKQNTNRIKLNMSKKALAERLGVQRTSLSRELKSMKEDGLILYDAESITILNLSQNFKKR